MEESPASTKSYPALLWHDIKSRKSEFFLGLLLSVVSSTGSVWLQYRDGMLERKRFWDGIVTASIPVLGIMVVFALVEVYRAARSLHRDAQNRIKELEKHRGGAKLSLTTETAEERYWNLRTQAEGPELAHKIITGYAGSADTKAPVPYLAIDYVVEWKNYVTTTVRGDEEYTEREEFLKFTNASDEVIRKIQVEPFRIWGADVSVESVPTLIRGEPVQKRVRRIEDQFQKANLGLRAFHKKPLGVRLTVNYYGQRDALPYSVEHELIYDKGNISVVPRVGAAVVDWLDASEAVEVPDEAGEE